MHFSTLTTLTLTLFPLFAPLPVQAAALAVALDKRDFVIAQPNPDTMVKIHAEPGVRIKGWPKHAEPNPQYDAEWQTDREFAMPDIRTGSPGAKITHEGKKWAVMAEAKDGALNAYCEITAPNTFARSVLSNVNHHFEFSIAPDGTRLQLSRCGCWYGLRASCTTGAGGPNKLLACGAVQPEDCDLTYKNP